MPQPLNYRNPKKSRAGEQSNAAVAPNAEVLAPKARAVIPIEFDTPDPGQAPGAATGGIVGFGRIIPFGRGGMVPFAAMGTDTVPAMLTPGEIILNAAQQRSVAGAVGDVAMRRELVGLRRDLQRQAEQMAIDRALQLQLLPKAMKAAVQQVA